MVSVPSGVLDHKVLHVWREQLQVDATKCASEVFEHLACLLLGFGEDRDVVGLRRNESKVILFWAPLGSREAPQSRFLHFPIPAD